MPRPHKPHRGRNAWKKDILRLTCLLRLRCSPPVPYTAIAELLIRTKAKATKHLVRLLGPEDWTSGSEQGLGDELSSEAREWLVGHLRNTYEGAERDRSLHWERVRDLDDESVREKIVELGGGLMEQKEEKERKLQSDWKTVEDWRVGSKPEPRPAPEQDGVLCLEEVAQTADVGRAESKETTSPISEERYLKDREQFFEDMVNNIINDGDGVLESRSQRITSSVVGGPRMETCDEELVWQPPKFDYPNSYRAILAEGYIKILAQLKEVTEVINNCNWELSVNETNRHWPNTAEIPQNIIAVHPDPGQPACDNSSQSSIRGTDERRITPRLIVEELESRFTGWQGYTDDDEDDTGPSPMMVVAEKVFKEWKSHGKTQAWLAMSR